MNILITGITGFIGGHLIKKLAQDGHKTFAIVRSSTNTEELKNAGIDFFTLHDNVLELANFIKNNNIRGVIHLASLFLASHSEKDIRDLIESNVLFSTQILEASVAGNVKWFINTGTFWQHYDNKEYSPVNLYSATKQALESISQYYIETSDINFVTIKLSDTFGPKDTRQKIFNLWDKISKTGESLDMSPGEQIIDISYIDNVIDGYIQMINLMDDDVTKVFNGKSFAIKSNEKMTLKNLAKTYEETTGTKLNINWGSREYRQREVMTPWDKGEPIPRWTPKISIHEGIKKMYGNYDNKSEQLKNHILSKVKEYYTVAHKSNSAFTPGESRINYSGRVYDENEMVNLVDSALEFWLTYGRYSRLFEKKFAEFLGVRYAFLVNSGSSANLLAFVALTSPLLGERQVKRDDEVITVAAGFPTTIAPIIQNGAIPVFVDIDIESLNIDVSKLEKAISTKTKAVMLAHTLGNPFNIRYLKDFCDKHNLWLIEDNCDALGSMYEGKFTGTFGDIGTSSFYPPHHMTMGEGGAVYTNDPLLKKIMLSIRDWGRDCWCDSGKDNTCSKRFSQRHGTLPFGYDHKYVYSHFGYNLKATDMQASIGCAQLEKLPEFIKKRKENFNILYNALKRMEKYFILPKATTSSEPSWFGFPLILKRNENSTRNKLVTYLEDKKIQTRNLFAGNVIRQPLFQNLKIGIDYKISESLDNTDKIMNNCFWIGTYPSLTYEALNYMAESIINFNSYE